MPMQNKRPKPSKIRRGTVRQKNRRKSNDMLTHVSMIIGSASWLIFLFAVMMSYYTAPDTNYDVLSYNNINIKNSTCNDI